MSSLLSAGIYRYRKSAVFRVMLLTALILGAITGAIADSSSQLNATYLFGMFLAAAIQISAQNLLTALSATSLSQVTARARCSYQNFCFR